MIELCEEEESTDNVALLAVNYIDRYMSLIDIDRTQLQLLGAVGLLVASKLGKTDPIKPQKLISCAGNYFTLKDMYAMESSVLRTLNWGLLSVTPTDFLIIF